MSHVRKLLSLGGAFLLLLVLVPSVLAQDTPAVTVVDQPIANGQVTVEQVISAGPGWIVIHAQADGKPGPILGYTQVNDGQNLDVVVDIDATNATQTLYAMLHTDAGTVGTWEFPGGADLPVKAGEVVITPSFQVTGGPPTTLPETGGVPFPWAAVLLGLGALMLFSGLGLAWARRSR
jgi:hypothetical protein